MKKHNIYCSLRASYPYIRQAFTTTEAKIEAPQVKKVAPKKAPAKKAAAKTTTTAKKAAPKATVDVAALKAENKALAAKVKKLEATLAKVKKALA